MVPVRIVAFHTHCQFALSPYTLVKWTRTDTNRPSAAEISFLRFSNGNRHRLGKVAYEFPLNISLRITMRTLVFVTFLLVLSNTASNAEESAAIEHFELSVRPLLIEHCVACHGVEKQEAGLRLDSAAGVRAGGDSGPLLVPGKPSESLILKALLYDNNDFQMPPRGRLSDEKISAVAKWIQQGATWPTEGTPSGEQREKTSHPTPSENLWAFQPLKLTTPARLQSLTTSNQVDGFVADKLVQAGMRATNPADDRTFIRRLYLDTTGLPPTVLQIVDYLKETAPDKYARQIDQMLASPHYGERMARHWLDVVGYVETAGHVTDLERQNTWLYRDYVIQAFNADLPYDQFVREHLAGDLMHQRRDSMTGAELSILGTGFLWFYEYHFKPIDPLQQRWNQIDAQIDIIGKAFLGLTIACARCHDHKFDPIQQRDYYALANFLNRTQNQYRQLLPKRQYPENHPVTKKRGEIRDRLKQGFKVARQDRDAKLNASIPLFEDDLDYGAKTDLMRLRDDLTKLDPTALHALVALDTKAQDIQLHIRGNYKNLGEVIPRQFLSVLENISTEGATQLQPSQQLSNQTDSRSSEKPVKRKTFKGSGRLQLAASMLDSGRHLVARVMANRLWQYSFGRGIVATSGNFGRKGIAPTHPELLDFLAHHLITHRWSVKAIHRKILESGTYRQSSHALQEHDSMDQENLLLHRAHVRRMDAETIFDSIRLATDRLQHEMFGESVPPYVSPFAIMNKNIHVPPSGPVDAAGRRAIYVKVRKNFVAPFFQTFDFPDPGVSVSRRDLTVVPAQSLALLNGEFIHREAIRWGAQLASDRRTYQEKLRDMHESVTGHPPTTDRLETLLALLHQQAAVAGEAPPGATAWADVAHVLWNLNDFLFIR